MALFHSCPLSIFQFAVGVIFSKHISDPASCLLQTLSSLSSSQDPSKFIWSLLYSVLFCFNSLHSCHIQLLMVPPGCQSLSFHVPSMPSCISSVSNEQQYLPPLLKARHSQQSCLVHSSLPSVCCLNIDFPSWLSISPQVRLNSFATLSCSILSFLLEFITFVILFLLTCLERTRFFLTCCLIQCSHCLV